MKVISIILDAIALTLILTFIVSWFGHPWLLIVGGMCILTSCHLWLYAHEESHNADLPSDEEDHSSN